jgi:hypothetical protein
MSIETLNTVGAGAVIAAILLWPVSLLRRHLWAWPSVSLFTGALILAAITGIYVDPSRLLAWIGLIAVVSLSMAFPTIAAGALASMGMTLTVLIMVGAAYTQGHRVFMNPNMVAALYLLTIGWASALPWAGALRFLWAPVLIFTGSRAAILGALGAYLIKWRRWWVIPVGVIAVAVAVAIRPGSVLVRWGELQSGINLWLQRPLTGWGPGAAPYLLGPGRIHFDCGPLSILVEMGLIGLIAWGVLVFDAARRLTPGPARWALLAWLISQAADDTLWWPWVLLAVGANIGLGLVKTKTTEVQDVGHVAWELDSAADRRARHLGDRHRGVLCLQSDLDRVLVLGDDCRVCHRRAIVVLQPNPG